MKNLEELKRLFAVAAAILSTALASAHAGPALECTCGVRRTSMLVSAASSCFVPTSSTKSGGLVFSCSFRRRRRRCFVWRTEFPGERLPPAAGALTSDGNFGEESVHTDVVQSHESQGNGVDRRGFLRPLTMSALALGPAAALWFSFARPTGAACLPGDTSPSCIGIYKVPLDDKILPYTSTPEMLRKVAPDVRWVPPVEVPKTYAEAYRELSGPLREKCEALKEKVLKGKLEEAGVEVLGIAPRVTVCGRAIVGGLYGAADKKADGVEENYSMRAYRITVGLHELEAAVWQCDVLIGQGMRGDLGVSAPAQIQIISELVEMNEVFADLIRIIPASIP